MNKNAIYGIILSLLLTGIFASVVNIHSVEAEPKAVYVDDDNTAGPWDGTPEHPYQNITSGLEHAVANDVVFVRNGTYYETIVANKTLSIIGESITATMINGSSTSDTVTITSNNVNISGFTITGPSARYGFYLENANNCNVSHNHIINVLGAIGLMDSDYNIISSNYCENITEIGMNIFRSHNNTILNNTLLHVTPPHPRAVIWVRSSSDNILSGNNITDTERAAIQLGNSSGPQDAPYGNIISNNYIAGSWEGIVIEDTYFEATYANVVMDNTITNCHHENYGYGIRISYLHEMPYDNIIIRNNITDCDDGISTTADGNVFYHNYVVDNSRNAFDYSGNNDWDNGYPSGGNYWGDYTGLDLYRGPYQNETGSDGIGDTPYYTSGSGIDNYPLMKPYGGDHDISIIDVTTSKTLVEKGDNLNITTTIFNYGIYNETFNVTVYANTATVASQKVTLTSRNSTVVIFTWNTMGVAEGDYTIIANVTSLPGETDTTDNTHIDGLIIIVTLLGDVNGDLCVDIFDKVIVGSVFGANYNATDGMYWHGPPDYPGPCIYCPHTPIADINKDGTVDVFDKVIVGTNFGRGIC